MNLKGPWEVPGANVFRVVAPNMEHQNKKDGMCPPYPWAIVADTDPESVGGAAAAAHARAIAALPDLVDACRRALDALGEDRTPTDRREAEHFIHRALRKAMDTPVGGALKDLSNAVEASLFLAKLKAEPGKCVSYSHGNESGTLWEKLWIFENGTFRAKICASGCFVDWKDTTEESALHEVQKDLETIKSR